MARENTFSEIDDKLDSDLEPEQTMPRNIETNSTDSNDKENPSQPTTTRKIRVAEETENKTFVLKSTIANAIDNTVTDEHGKKLPGSRGFISKLANSAFTRELVRLGLMDKEEIKKLPDLNDYL